MATRTPERRHDHAVHAGGASHKDAHGHDGGAHGSFRGYMTGFGLSVVLTAIPFWLVMARPIESAFVTTMIIMAFAAIQIVVHMIYFLHMTGRSEGLWTLSAMIFTLIVVAICLIGSLWVMYHLNTNMMPPMDGHAGHGGGG